MDRTTAAQIDTILADLASKGGGTYEATTLIPFAPTTGYAIGIGGIHLPMADVSADSALWAIKAVGTEYETSFVGTWLDEGVVYFDAVKYTTDEQEAVRLAYRRGQKAIWSFERSEALRPGQITFDQ